MLNPPEGSGGFKLWGWQGILMGKIARLGFFPIFFDREREREAVKLSAKKKLSGWPLFTSRWHRRFSGHRFSFTIVVRPCRSQSLLFTHRRITLFALVLQPGYKNGNRTRNSRWVRRMKRGGSMYCLYNLWNPEMISRMEWRPPRQIGDACATQ